ncbi:hypothetical protein [Pseudomonas sp. F1_0610]|uniref:CRISPR-associated endonuclease Cas2 n=1 Tax=Pseudomonas sp. F1_0610 TaxID=3114284 RepID=UPI0039C0CC12
MNWLICYDIENSKSRQKVCRLLRRYSAIFQKSGYELNLCLDINPITDHILTYIKNTDKLLIIKCSEKGASWSLGRLELKSYNDLLVWV